MIIPSLYLFLRLSCLFFLPLSSTFFSNLSETNSRSNISHSSFLRHFFQDFTKGHPFHIVFFNLNCLPTSHAQTGEKTPDRRLKDLLNNKLQKGYRRDVPDLDLRYQLDWSHW